ncbi:BON domain-containing protein [Paraburkholderia adhaesiva]|uniref:BON domain-containing protein n=1 Tax=Paraburkholderia adhaesiva TaxID=2883244 RepID=UPI001F4224A8|nr:BON domain-containing protein [Paraburkholderia adhaesiva]
MKAIQAFKLAAGTMLVAASLQVYAQDAASPAAAASGPTEQARQQHQEAKAQYRAARAANRALARKVRAALARDSSVSVANITVRAKDGAVTLQGTVPAQPQIDRATEIAKGVEGVTSVKNALSIRPVGT